MASQAASTVRKCTNCGASLYLSNDRCLSCNEHAGYPNVWAAEEPEQKKALADRVHNANVSVSARNCTEALESFEASVKEAKAVLCVGSHFLVNLQNPKNMLPKFYKQLSSNARALDHNDKWEMLRTQIDPLLFPAYADSIGYAALSLDGKGVSFFGDCHLTLKTALISRRATAFEENSCAFYTKHNCHKNFPAGFRAVWDDKQHLAKAKLHSNLNKETQRAQFPEILLSNADKDTADFIEIHIYGTLNIGTVESIKMPTAKNKQEQGRYDILQRQLISLMAA